jgi:hypothetical protein
MLDTLDEVLKKRCDLQLKLLDEAHTRARGPGARRKIEKKMSELRTELEAIREKAKVVDIEYARWARHFNEVLEEKT